MISNGQGWVKVTNGIRDWSTFTPYPPTSNPEIWEPVQKIDCQCQEDCGVEVETTNQETFPRTVYVTLGTTTGIVQSDFNTLIAGVEKFELYYNDVMIYTSGYIGDVGLQGDLDIWLGDRGLPPETISGTPSAMYSFYKSTSYPDNVIVKVYAPLPDYQWNFTVSCPTVS